MQREPNGVAFTPDGTKLFVANTVDGTVSVIPLNIPNGVIGKPTKHIAVGTEPYALALTPNGTKLYVANARSNNVSVIDTASERGDQDDSRTWASSRAASRSPTTATRDDIDETRLRHAVPRAARSPASSTAPTMRRPAT